MLSTLKSVFTKLSQWYTKVACFTVNTGTLHALAISNDGQILATGGAEGVKLWNIQSRKEVPCSSPAHDASGAVSCTTWVKTRHSVGETLCYGTGRGYLVFLRPNPVDKHFQEICVRRLGLGFEVTCIAWDASWSEGGSQIAVGMRDNIIQVLQLNSNSQLQSVFAGRLDNTVPKSIAFADHSDLYIFGLFDGKVIKMSVANGTILSEHHYDSVIGCAAVSLRKGLIVVDNATNGFTLYRLDCADPIRTYLTDPPTVPVPKQVAFGEESKIVAGGSDNGLVYIFERRSGKLLETLQHSKDGLVQAIAVRDVVGQCFVASASPVAGRKKATINVWTHKYESRKLPTSHNDPWTFGSALRILTQLVTIALVLATVIFFLAGVG
ncbi:hypothetical protein HYDPIDRAFT_25126 [Hydnomerulius pinastri MD-312]|nr:hypothetical protein HYDPIDRAFT_25126 [Hydnomerulius pinastri MD-312]